MTSLSDSSPRDAERVGGATRSASRTTEPNRGADLVCDVELVALAVRSEMERYVGLLLMRAQSRTWTDRRHLLDLSEREAARQLRAGLNNGRLATFIVRCSRCGCIALLSDWLASVDDPEYPLIADRRFLYSDFHLIDTSFLAPCEGNRIFMEALSLLE
jgi:hypothetical protein